MFPYLDIYETRIYFYPLFMGLAWGAGFNLVLFYQKLLSLEIKDLKTLLIIQFLAAWIGAKVLFLITSSQSESIQSNVNFWLGGGFVFYGGMIFTIVVTLLFIYLKKISFNDCNIFFPALALAHGIGRIGCFLTGCCYGKSCTLPWAVHMHGEFRHPVQLYEAILLFILFYFCHKLLTKKPKVLLWPRYLLSYGVIRLVIEAFRGDSIRGVDTLGISTSQYISIGMIIISVTYLFSRRLKNK